MSGTSLIILAMYSTVNVVAPNGSMLTSANYVFLVTMLVAAASLTLLGMFITATPSRRVMPKGPSLPRAQRRLSGPGVRRH